MGWPNKSSPQSESLASAASLGLFVIPLIGLIYTLVSTLGLIESPNIFSLLEASLYTAAWLLVATGLSLKRNESQNLHLLYLLMYHIFMAAYLVISTAANSELVYLWIIIALITYLYSGWLGLTLSLIGLYITQALILTAQGELSLFLPTLITFAIVSITTILVALITRRISGDKQHLDSGLDIASVQHDRLLTVINNIVSSVIATDTNGNISVYNAATLNLLDTNLELSHTPIDDVLLLESANGERIVASELLQITKTVLTRDDIYLPVGNERLQLELTISPTRSTYKRHKHKQDISGYILIMQDVTQAKSLEEEKDEFISVVSHELRTPITVTEGTISNVLAMIDKQTLTPEKQKEAIEMAHEQVIFLSKMINDLSTLSRAERGLGDDTSLIDIPKFVRELYHEYQPSAAKKGLHLNLDMPTQVGAVHTSELYLKELLQNLITNAIKYTEQGSITIVVTQDKSTITIAVKDTGIGISKADQSRVMERFFRSEDYRTRETGGTGLGLYVADKLARKIDTRINLRSRLNHGSTFWIELEAAQITNKID